MSVVVVLVLIGKYVGYKIRNLIFGMGFKLGSVVYYLFVRVLIYVEN